MREINIDRNTKETNISLKLNLDGNGDSSIDTGIGFMNHMLTLFSFHSGIDLNLICKGDLDVDGHHSVEDIGILLGKAISKALGDKKGINRYGDNFLPMDETLVHTSLDISGRSYLVWKVELPAEKLGNYETELTEEFFRAISMNSGMTLHINLMYGKNTHHIIEAVFKSFGRSLKQAILIDEKNKDKIVSTKGILE